MYELLILGLLMTRDMSGYKLRSVLGSTLVPRREISNGVMYPLLNKLAQQGDIELTEDQTDPRKSKMAHITSTGIAHFQELMRMPVAENAKRDSIFQFKFRGMASVDPAVQQVILDDFRTATEGDFQIYDSVKQHLVGKIAEGDSRGVTLQWAVDALDLNIQLCETKFAWIDQRQKDIREREQE